MRKDSRLSRVLHVLIHMDRHCEQATSETLSQMLNTNAVVVRRTMAGMRKLGYVSSEGGHGGGWKLTKPLEDITLYDVYRAMGEPPLFNLGPPEEHPECLVARAVDAALKDAMQAAEDQLLARFRSITVAQLAEDFETLYALETGNPNPNCSSGPSEA